MTRILLPLVLLLAACTPPPKAPPGGSSGTERRAKQRERQDSEAHENDGRAPRGPVESTQKPTVPASPTLPPPMIISGFPILTTARVTAESCEQAGHKAIMLDKNKRPADAWERVHVVGCTGEAAASGFDATMPIVTICESKKSCEVILPLQKFNDAISANAVLEHAQLAAKRMAKKYGEPNEVEGPGFEKVAPACESGKKAMHREMWTWFSGKSPTFRIIVALSCPKPGAPTVSNVMFQTQEMLEQRVADYIDEFQNF